MSTPEDYQAMLDAQVIAAAERVVAAAEKKED